MSAKQHTANTGNCWWLLRHDAPIARCEIRCSTHLPSSISKWNKRAARVSGGWQVNSEFYISFSLQPANAFFCSCGLPFCTWFFHNLFRLVLKTFPRWQDPTTAIPQDPISHSNVHDHMQPQAGQLVASFTTIYYCVQANASSQATSKPWRANGNGSRTHVTTDITHQHTTAHLLDCRRRCDGWFIWLHTINSSGNSCKGGVVQPAMAASRKQYFKIIYDWIISDMTAEYYFYKIYIITSSREH